MIIYLHDFASGSHSARVRELRTRLPHIDVFAPDYPAHRVEEALAFLQSYVTERAESGGDDPFLAYMLVGPRLGGFYAKLLSRVFPFFSVVMINPMLSPSRTLKPWVGCKVDQHTGQTFTFTEADLTGFAPYETQTIDPVAALTVLLDEGDEVTPSREALELYTGRGRVIVYPGGSPEFDHMAEAIPQIERAYYTIAG